MRTEKHVFELPKNIYKKNNTISLPDSHVYQREEETAETFAIIHTKDNHFCIWPAFRNLILFKKMQYGNLQVANDEKERYL